MVTLCCDLLEVDLLGCNWGWVEAKRDCCNLSLEVVEHLGGGVCNPVSVVEREDTVGWLLSCVGYGAPCPTTS